MGTANKQISIQSNVALKRINPGYTGTMCVTKSDITPIEFLQVNNRAHTSKILFYANDYGTLEERKNSLSIICGSKPDSQYVNAENVYLYRNTVNQYSVAYVNMPFNVYSNTSTTVELKSTWPSSGSSDSTDKYENVALFSQRFSNVPTNTSITINYTGFANGNLCSVSFSNGTSGVSSFSPTSAIITMGIIVTNDAGGVIATKSPTSYNNNNVNDSFSFSSTDSTINIYFIFPMIKVVFLPTYNDYYTGLDMTLTVEMEYYESYYDQTYKCVQYQDINHPTGKTFTVYYGIWNNKSSNAQLDKVYAQIKKTTESSWTTIGTKSIGTVDTSTTGSFTCTLPANFDPKVQYDFRMCCGETKNAQEWYYRWGAQSTVTASGYSWTYCGKYTTGWCNADAGLNQNSSFAVLGNYYNPSGMTSHRGRSASNAAIFCIE